MNQSFVGITFVLAAAFAVDHARSAQAPVLLVRRRGLVLSLEAP